SFDHLWITGLNNEAWPPPAMPNPFITQALQHRLNMPHASAQRQIDYAQKMTQRLKHSAKEVIFSYARQEQGRTLEVSELLRELPCTHAQHSPLSPIESLFEQVVLEKQLDEQAPPLEPLHFTANSQTLALQAACPFKAFAQERLRAKAEMEPSLWLLP